MVWERGRLTVVLAAVLCASGCAAESPPTPVTASPTSSPVFASEEEALAAATEAYAAYQEGLDVALSTYDTTSIADFVVSPELEEVRKSVADFQAKRQHQTGSVGTHGTRLVDAAKATGSTVRLGASLQIYSCLDVVGVDVIDEEGVSVVPDTQPPSYPMIVSLTWDEGTGKLAVAQEDVWSGENFCD